MKRFLYIGQLTKGSTSRMRADILKNLLVDYSHESIDTNVPFLSSSRILRSITFRFKKGPIINKINKYIQKRLNDNYDLIWVDKAVYITLNTTKLLKSRTHKLIHFTPDPAFTYHQSEHFFSSLPLYDYAVTTKTFEYEFYVEKMTEERVILTTQGYDKHIHKFLTPFKERNKAVLFIGHYEKHRGKIINELIKSKIECAVAGKGWNAFIKKHKFDATQISYLGEGLYGAQYSGTINDYMLSLGLLSRLIPEKHTTRTFEIPACGTALVTEVNEELKSHFNPDEVIFYNSVDELIEKIKFYFSHLSLLEEMAEKGNRRVQNGGYDYSSIVSKILSQVVS